MGELVLLLGGARSGKSDYAQRLAWDLGGEQVLFVATAEAGDKEMEMRIEAHRRSRPQGWRTVEAPTGTAEAMGGAIEDARAVLVDCVTLLVSNVMLALGDETDAARAWGAVARELEGIVDLCAATTATFIVVSNEVGLGLVPDNALGRLYRDLLGRANQLLASRADKVYWMVAGLPLEVKALAAGS